MITKEGSTRIANFMTPGARVLVQWCGYMSYLVKLHLLYSVAWFRQTKCKVMMTKEGSTKILNFMTPGAVVLMKERGHISYIVKIHFFLNLLLYFKAEIRQTVGLVLMKKGSTKIVIIFITPSEWVLVLVCGHVCYIVKMHFFFMNLLAFHIFQTNWEYSNDDQERVYQNGTILFTYQRVRVSCTVAWLYKLFSEIALLLLNLLLISGAWFRQTKCKVMLTIEGSFKIVNFMTPVAGFLVQGRGYKSYMVNIHYFLK